MSRPLPKPGDFIKWTVFAAENVEHNPLWARIVGLTGKRGSSTTEYGVVKVVAQGATRQPIGSKFETSIFGWPPSDAVTEIFTEEEMPEEAWVQIAKEQLS